MIKYSCLRTYLEPAFVGDYDLMDQRLHPFHHDDEIEAIFIHVPDVLSAEVSPIENESDLMIAIAFGFLNIICSWDTSVMLPATSLERSRVNYQGINMLAQLAGIKIAQFIEDSE